MENLAALLDEGLARLAIDLDAAARALLFDYMALLQKWSAKTNLIARNASDTEIVEHFLDSLALLPLLPSTLADTSVARLMDVGSGAGFPGLALAAARPALFVSLVEPRQKRAAFLRQVIRSLHLEHVTCHECRLEEIAPGSLPCSHIASRAVASLAGFVAMCEPWLSEGVQIICMKSRKWRQELAEAQTIIARLGPGKPQVTSYRLPFSGAERVTLLFTAGAGKVYQSLPSLKAS
jgi:16S rRNA (guanine527-N7)-methyltransferase